MVSQSEKKVSDPTFKLKLPEVTEGVFVGGSFAIVGLGFLAGLKYSMNKEKELFKKHSIPAHYAAKAFLYGTLLCVGTFATIGSLIVFSTGITNAKEFGREMKKLFGNTSPDVSASDAETDIKNMKQGIMDFLIENDETNQAKDILTQTSNNNSC